MATGSILLPIGAAVLPDGSTSNLGLAMRFFAALLIGTRRAWRPC